MTKRTLSPVPGDTPVNVAVELQAAVFRDLQAYSEILARANGTIQVFDKAILSVVLCRRRAVRFVAVSGE